MADCFDKIIGFTKTECNCFDESDKGADADKSDSGLFMDELPETAHILKVAKASAGCGKKMANVFSLARTNAIFDFKERVLIEMGTRFQVKQNPFVGLLGQSSFNAALALTSDYCGAIYEMRPLRGGIMRVNRIYVGINQTRAVQVKVYKAYNIGTEYQVQGPPIQTIDVNAVANQVTVLNLETPIDLPLTDDQSSQNIYYLFVMDRSTGFQPLDMKASCGCDNQNTVEKWLLQGGIEGDDLDHLPSSARRTGKAANVNGIVADVEIKCNDTGFVCEAYSSSPFVKIAIQHAILYQACSNLLNSILRGENLDRYALTKREQMATDAAILHGKFKQRVLWVAENIDMKSHNCFVCNTVNETAGPYKAGIRF